MTSIVEISLGGSWHPHLWHVGTFAELLLALGVTDPMQVVSNPGTMLAICRAVSA